MDDEDLKVILTQIILKRNYFSNIGSITQKIEFIMNNNMTKTFLLDFISSMKGDLKIG